jgi:type VI secretion system protein
LAGGYLAEPRSHLPESLFEKLADQYADGTPISAVPAEQRRAKSIADHLWRMFNTRQGAIPHLPDYGLPDITEIYRKLPASLKELETTILSLANKYEPRLERVRIRPLPTNPSEFRLNFELSATVRNGERISFQTSFHTSGETQVQPLRARS